MGILSNVLNVLSADVRGDSNNVHTDTAQVHKRRRLAQEEEEERRQGDLSAVLWAIR